MRRENNKRKDEKTRKNAKTGNRERRWEMFEEKKQDEVMEKEIEERGKLGGKGSRWKRRQKREGNTKS